jgi:multisubunit Na+/H+ antiporter MnhB subunit
VTGPLPPERQRRRVPVRVWLLVGLIALLVIITATGGIRDWWAHRLHDITSGNHTADYLIGLVIGLLPIIGVAAGVLATRGRGRLHRAWRMFLYGAAGFVVTYLLSPSLARMVTDSQTRHVFEHLAPAYLPGVLTGTAVWLVGLVVALYRVRARRHARRLQPPADGHSQHRVIDV